MKIPVLRDLRKTWLEDGHDEAWPSIPKIRHGSRTWRAALRRGRFLFKSFFLLASLSLATLAQAQADRIKVSIGVSHGKNLISHPSITITPGETSKIEITRDFVHADGRILPVGVILDASASFEEGKIKYSCLLTLRESVKSQDSAGNHASRFKTEEFMLSGVVESGKEVRFDLGDNTTVTATLTRVNPVGVEIR